MQAEARPGEDRRGVGADREEGGVAEIQEAGEAHHHVEPEGEQDVDDGEARPPGDEVVGLVEDRREGAADGEGEDCQHHGPAEQHPREAGGDAGEHQPQHSHPGRVAGIGIERVAGRALEVEGTERGGAVKAGNEDEHQDRRCGADEEDDRAHSRQHRCGYPSKRRHGVGGEPRDRHDHPEGDQQQEDVAGPGTRGVQKLLRCGWGELGADAGGHVPGLRPAHQPEHGAGKADQPGTGKPIGEGGDHEPGERHPDRAVGDRVTVDGAEKRRGPGDAHDPGDQKGAQ